MRQETRGSLISAFLSAVFLGLGVYDWLSWSKVIHVAVEMGISWFLALMALIPGDE